jgi:hypothetical protein
MCELTAKSAKNAKCGGNLLEKNNELNTNLYELGGVMPACGAINGGVNKGVVLIYMHMIFADGSL